MESKKVIIGIESFETIKNVILLDATEVSKRHGAVVFARYDPAEKKHATAVMIAGEGIGILWCIARIIYRLHIKSGRPVSEVINIVSELIEEIENEDR